MKTVRVLVALALMSSAALAQRDAWQTTSWLLNATIRDSIYYAVGVAMSSQTPPSPIVLGHTPDSVIRRPKIGSPSANIQYLWPVGRTATISTSVTEAPLFHVGKWVSGRLITRQVHKGQMTDFESRNHGYYLQTFRGRLLETIPGTSQSARLDNGTGDEDRTCASEALVIPHHADSSTYYLVVIDTMGVAYSIVRFGPHYLQRQNDSDISFLAIRQRLLRHNAVQSMAATLDCNGSGWWLIVRCIDAIDLYGHTYTATYYTIHISPTGIRQGPTTQERLSQQSNDVFGGVLTISPDARHVVYSSRQTLLYSFDNRTGQLQRRGVLLLTSFADNGTQYTVPVSYAFSPGSQYLYVLTASFDKSCMQQPRPEYRTCAIDVRLGRYLLADLSKYQQLRQWSRTVDRGSLSSIPPSTYPPINSVFQIAADGKLYFSYHAPSQYWYLDSAKNLLYTLASISNPDSPAPLIDTLQIKIPTTRTWHVATVISAPAFPLLGLSDVSTDASPWLDSLLNVFTKYPPNLLPNYINSVFAPNYPESVARCAPPQVQLASRQVCTDECILWRPAVVRFAPTEYRWRFEGGSPSQFIGSDPPPICYQQPGTYRTTLIACNSNGCDTAVASVVVVQSPRVVVTGDTVLCAGRTGTLRASGAEQYQWRILGSDSVLSTSNELATLGGMRYIIIGRNANGCTVADTITVHSDAVSALRLDTMVCRDSRVVLHGGRGSQYIWRTSDGRVISTAAQLEINATAEQEYRVEVVGTYGCRDTGWVRLRVGDQLTIIAPDQQACTGTPLTLSVTNAGSDVTYTWFDSTGTAVGTGPKFSIIADRSTWYVVVGTNTLGCSGRDTVRVEVTDNLAVVATGDTSVCPGSRVILSVVQPLPDAEYTWYRDGTELGRGPVISIVAEQSQHYIVHGHRSRCQGYDTVHVMVYPAVELQSDDVHVCEGDAAVLSLEGNGERCWWTDETGQILSHDCQYRTTGRQTQRFIGFMTNAHGCQDSVTVTLWVKPRPVVEVWTEPQHLTIQPGQSAELAVVARASDGLTLEQALLHVRLPAVLADVVDGRSVGEWIVVERALGHLILDQQPQQLARVDLQGVLGPFHTGSVLINLDGEGCYTLFAQDGRIERSEQCADKLLNVQLVDAVQVIQHRDEIEVQGSGVEEVRLYRLDGREQLSSRTARLSLAELPSGAYLLRIRVGDRWQWHMVTVMR